MKVKNFFAASVLALSGLALAGHSAHASTFSAGSTDLILGFYISGATQQDVLTVDLGPASQFYAPSSSSFTLTGLTLADLLGIYGANWFTNPLLNWGVVGTAGIVATGDGHAKGYTVWDTVALGGTRPASTRTNLATAVTKINTLYGNLTNVTATGNSATAFKDITTNTTSYYGEDTSSTASFGIFNPSVDNNYNNVISNVQYSSLWEQQPGATPTATGTASLLGTFALGSNGVLTFTAAPEPTSAVLAIGAGLAMLASRRRRLV
jgi:hypothetical protein